MRELLPSTSRAWAALAVITVVVAGLAFGVDDAAGITALSVVTGLTLLNLGRVARWAEPRRVGQLVEQAQRPAAKEIQRRLDGLTADVDQVRRELAGIAEQMSSLRLTVAQAASTIAEHRGDAS